MANESDTGQEKTEQPTAKKLRDAKQKGQVPRSKELNSMTIMVFGALGLLFMGSHMIEHISGGIHDISCRRVFQAGCIRKIWYCDLRGPDRDRSVYVSDDGDCDFYATCDRWLVF
jgi:hypothetical protein